MLSSESGKFKPAMGLAAFVLEMQSFATWTTAMSSDINTM
jgi:hypothetical protein